MTISRVLRLIGKLETIIVFYSMIKGKSKFLLYKVGLLLYGGDRRLVLNYPYKVKHAKFSSLVHLGYQSHR